MSEKKRLVLLGVASFVLGLVILLPARVAYSLLAPDSVRLSALSGTVWNGRAAEGQFTDLYLKNISWTVRPFALLTGKLALDARFDPADGFMETRVAVSPGGTVTFTQLQGAVSIAALGSVLPAPGIDGNVRLDLSRLTLEQGLPTEADGTVEVVGLIARGLAPVPIGNYKAELTTTADGIAGSVEDTAGILDIAGALTLTRDRSYALTGLVASTDSTPDAVNSQLRFLGSPNERGQREFRFEGQL